MKSFTITFATVAVTVFLLTVLAERILIPILRSHKLGQKILDIGPRWHKSKEGTPTMGGIAFIFAMLTMMYVSDGFPLEDYFARKKAKENKKSKQNTEVV